MAVMKFGTDGVRGFVGENGLSPTDILHLGWSAGKALLEDGAKAVLIGKDTRLSGYMLETALQSGLVSSGIDVKVIGPMPTPGIAYLTQTFRGDAGIVISASHNPYYDNGVKFFNAEGKKISDHLQSRIEFFMTQEIQCTPSDRIGRITRLEGASDRYIEFCKSKFPSRFSLAGKHIVLDCAHGATYHIAPSVFKELGANVTLIGTSPSGTNINDGCGATSTQSLSEKVVAVKADVGIAFDGDGDRVIMVDHEGNTVDGDQILFILARDALKNGRLKGGVVGTTMTNMAMELALKQLGVRFIRANVGDRHVLASLVDSGSHIGGESSGHILNLHHSPTGDAIVAALQVLTAMERCEMPLKELNMGFKPYPSVLKNIPVDNKSAIMNNSKVKEAVSIAESNLNGAGRVVLRPSGTESLIRIYIEGEVGFFIEELCEDIAKVIQSQIKR
jgi:phosphoglucosamine mutase